MSKLLCALKQHFGFDSFRRGQQEAIEKIIDGHSTAAIFPTGAGKSLCYQLPAMMQPHLTLVVSPLLSLMKDQLDFLHSHNIPAARLDSTLTGEQYNEIVRASVAGDLKILMISVERFKNERFRNQLHRIQISLLVVDEAHCISEWGHNFRPEYLRLPDYRREFNIDKILLLTATATEKVTADMCAKFQIRRENVVTTGFHRPNLYLKISPVEENRKKKKLLQDLSENPGQPAIVYVTLQKRAEDVASWLTERGIKASAYHGGMKSDERVLTQNKFMNGEMPCVVATIAFGMGIDKLNIRKIIHYDLPKSIENYSQEIGRAGRDGKPSICEVYACKSNLSVLENFVYGDTPTRKSLFLLLKEIKQAGNLWEFKAAFLGRDTNIRPLPLKTLLVYLSIKKVISPKYSYFEEYSFKYLQDEQTIIDQFRGERKEFVRLVLQNCQSKKIWTTVDMESLVDGHRVDRKRILAALDYFDDKKWIDLTASQAVEVYTVLDPDFDPEILGDALYTLFKDKEESEIARIHHMIRFFEEDSCYSRRLAAYFGEDLTTDECGHCSFCSGETVVMTGEDNREDLESLDKNVLTAEALSLLQEDGDANNLARFLCGLTSPLFTRLKLKKLNAFGVLEQYPFRQVEEWLKT